MQANHHLIHNEACQFYFFKNIIILTKMFTYMYITPLKITMVFEVRSTNVPAVIP